MTRKTPVYVVGLDAADHELIERWADHMPALTRLKANGMYSILDSTARVCSGSAWPSIVTGCDPSMCGVYSRYQIENGTYNVHRVKAEDNLIEPFWASLKAKSVVIDAPKAPLLQTFENAQIVEWGAYDHYSRFCATPDSLAHELITEFGEHPFMPNDFEVKLNKRRDFSELHTLLIDGILKKQKLNLSLVKKLNPDLFVSVFGETHAAGHALWRFQDKRHPLYDADDSMRDALRKIYIAIDQVIDEFNQTLPEDSVLVILSSHGFELDSMAGEDFLSDLLIKIGISVPRHPQPRYAPYVPGLTLDMARTKAFCLPTDLQGYIRINIEGREPNGIVLPEHYKSVCQKIEDDLMSFSHRNSGKPLVKEVARLHDIFDGAFASALPDLSVIWNTDQIATEVSSQRYGVVQQQPDLSTGGGNHHGVGWILVHGPGVGGARVNGHVLDVAPTIARLLGEEPRDHWQGSSLIA
ncbi:MAG: alkaline phosphatase family protein [Arenicellales bacterium]